MGGLLTAKSFEDQFHLDTTMQGTVTSLFIVGALFGCLSSALLNGKWGRKTVAHAGSLTLSLGAVLQASSYSVAQLLVGRIVAGVGLGVCVLRLKFGVRMLTECSSSSCPTSSCGSQS